MSTSQVGLPYKGRSLAVSSTVRRAPKFSFGSATSGLTKLLAKSAADVPGPGAYEPEGSRDGRKRTAQAFSFRPKPRSLQSNTNAVVGPGSYDPSDKLSKPASSRGGFSHARRSAGPSSFKSFQPGPGAYDTRADMTKQGLQFSFRRKPAAMDPTRGTPGPGAYEAPASAASNSATARSVHGIAKHSSRAVKFSGSQRNLAPFRNENPGPGAYDHAAGTSVSARQPPAYSIRGGGRPKLKRPDNPGPGAYDAAYTQFS
ncbi:unnamed protein product [Amoebophrya sp. A120]|nr:unnamed protein product [Amoebophrya sp. A120]|eukprot:GSA120T00025224001.1